MSWIRWRSPLLAGVTLSAVCAFACQATYNKRTGELNIEFAPDMTIHAMGLEEALDDLIELLGQCRAGTFPRPCTEAERADIREAIGKVVEAKENARPDPPEQQEEFDV